MRILKTIIIGMGLLLSFAPADVIFADVNDFYFKSATFDYYLSRTEDGSSEMQVVEELAAVFPDSDQNHGIERCLPTSYNGGAILDDSNFNVTRNGEIENYTAYNNGGRVCLRIGNSDSFVHGEQNYTISYKNINVITDSNDSTYQKLYWNTNGTGWSQKFDSVTASVHLQDEVKDYFIDGTSCYVGTYGTAGEEATSRCNISKADDNTVIFEANDLLAGETLTFVMQFQPDSFVINANSTDLDSRGNRSPQDDQSTQSKHSSESKQIIPPVVDICLTATVVSIASIFIGVYIYYYVKYRQKIPRLTEKTCPVQYTPPKNLTAEETALIDSGLNAYSNTAAIIEMVLQRRIALEKVAWTRKRFLSSRDDTFINWKIHIKDVESMTPYQCAVLMILNKNQLPKNGDTISLDLDINNSDYKLRKGIMEGAVDDEIDTLKRKKMLTKDAKTENASVGLQAFRTLGLLLFTLALFLCFTICTNMEGIWRLLLLALGFLVLYLHKHISEYESVAKYYTDAGINAKLYLIGLKKYMSLAEKERIELLQSVDGADVSSDGIVKLYEKLLPYAIIFRLEKSWIEELKKYYEASNMLGPDWAFDGTMIDASDLDNFSLALGMYTGNGSGDSGYDGGDFGGGGDFSGGGGGGGGGGGW
ncbi:MAG: DUF2207 domain-containing protein [Candidatus Saccharimonadaceae bacterium]|nr:DUF2207 domain-containing protein [Candidatus Saccharimonadaceae bacterium]